MEKSYSFPGAKSSTRSFSLNYKEETIPEHQLEACPTMQDTNQKDITHTDIQESSLHAGIC